MHEARLEQRLESGEPKCANCKHWRQKGVNVGSEDEPKLERLPFGACNKFHSDYALITTDLTVCSKWEQRPVAVKPGHSVLMGEPVWTEWEQKDK